MMNTAYFDHSSPANGFYNSAAAAEAHQAAYRQFSQLSLMPSVTSVANAAYANSVANIRPGGGGGSVPGVNVTGSGDVSNNYADCKLYNDGASGSQQQPPQQQHSNQSSPNPFSVVKNESSPIKNETNGFKLSLSSGEQQLPQAQPHHSHHHHHHHPQMPSPWQQAAAAAATSAALRPSPSSGAGGMSTPDMRNFDAAAWSACCNNNAMNANAMSAGPNAFYPWMAIAGMGAYSINILI